MYQTMDRVVADNMKCASNSVKSSNRGHQFSNKVVTCSNRVKLWEEVLSRTRRHKPFTRHILRLVEKIGYKIHVHQKFGIKTVRQKLTDPRIKKTAAQKEDADNRQKQGGGRSRGPLKWRPPRPRNHIAQKT